MNQPIEVNQSLFQTLIEWAVFPGNWIVKTLANTDFGAYLGFVEADINGVFAIALSIILTPIIVFLLIYPFKNFIDVILHCMKHKLRKDRIKCKTGFVVLILFLSALIVKQYSINVWIQNSVFIVFAIAWLIWFSQGRYFKLGEKNDS